MQTWLEFLYFYSYNIYNFQKFQNGTYDYVKIGEFNGNYDILKLKHSVQDYNFSEGLELYRIGTIQYPGGESKKIKSVCSDPCLPGHIKVGKINFKIDEHFFQKY